MLADRRTVLSRRESLENTFQLCMSYAHVDSHVLSPGAKDGLFLQHAYACTSEPGNLFRGRSVCSATGRQRGERAGGGRFDMERGAKWLRRHDFSPQRRSAAIVRRARVAPAIGAVSGSDFNPPSVPYTCGGPRGASGLVSGGRPRALSWR
jgi:hypothetical protein